METKNIEMQVMTKWSSRCIKTKLNKTMSIKTITYLETIFYPWHYFFQVSEATPGEVQNPMCYNLFAPVYNNDICWMGCWLQCTFILLLLWLFPLP